MAPKRYLKLRTILLRDKELREDGITGLNVIQKSGEHLLMLITIKKPTPLV